MIEQVQPFSGPVELEGLIADREIVVRAAKLNRILHHRVKMRCSRPQPRESLVIAYQQLVVAAAECERETCRNAIGSDVEACHSHQSIRLACDRLEELAVARSREEVGNARSCEPSAFLFEQHIERRLHVPGTLGRGETEVGDRGELFSPCPVSPSPRMSRLEMPSILIVSGRRADGGDERAAVLKALLETAADETQIVRPRPALRLLRSRFSCIVSVSAEPEALASCALAQRAGMAWIADLSGRLRESAQRRSHTAALADRVTRRAPRAFH